MVESEKELGKIGFDVETGRYWGEVLHLCGKETFYADTVDDLRRLLRESVPQERRGRGTREAVEDDAYFESLIIHLEPLLFYKLNQQAMLQGKSLHETIVGILREVMEETQLAEPLALQ